MKVSRNFSKFSNHSKSTSFYGTPHRLPPMDVHNYRDALKVWDKLKSAKYLDAHCNDYYDKSIRANNYSFLDKLTSYNDKTGFIEKFCEFTKFPSLADVSNKIDDTFRTCIRNISIYLSNKFNTSGFDIVDYGYDPTCSLGLRKAFPGSDLDKGYIILKGKGANETRNDKSIIDEFKGELWNELDQRIISLNHPDTFPSVYTERQIHTTLNYLDDIAEDIICNKQVKTGFGAMTALSVGSIFGPIGMIGGIAAAGLILNASNNNSTDPYKAGKFNINIARKIDNPEIREKVKNFAFFIETVKANLKEYPFNDKLIFERIKKSPFVAHSNVTQIGAWQKKIAGGYMKTKLRQRESLESDFYKMATDTKYDLVKDIIKYGTDEQSDKFSQYFKNDDDIAHRYKKLLDNLK